MKLSLPVDDLNKISHYRLLKAKGVELNLLHDNWFMELTTKISFI